MAVDFILNALKQGQELWITTVTVVEFLSYPILSTTDEAFFYEQAMKFVHIADVNMQLAKQAAILRKKYKLKLGDSIIAALAVINNASLATSDKDFAKVKELKIVNI